MIEIRNRRRFRLDLARFAKEMDISLSIVLRRTALGIFERITEKTPVDKGFARWSWQIGINSPPDAKAIDLDGEAPGEEGAKQENHIEARQLSRHFDPYRAIWVTSYLPYILRLEDGWSRKAPQGMVKVSIEEEVSGIRSAVRELGQS